MRAVFGTLLVLAGASLIFLVRGPLAATPAGVGHALRPAAAAAKPARSPGRAGLNSCKTCLERGAILDPKQFAQGYEPNVELAYLAAQRYPDTIDRIHCFCECKESAREHHKTLLTCFTNLHAAGCGICQHEAIMAAKMKDQGASDDEVEITVESLHRTEGHPPTFGRGI